MLRVAITDPGHFTPAYDRALAGALSGRVDYIRLVASQAPDPVLYHPHYYRMLQNSESWPPMIKRIAKGLSHGLDSWRLTRFLDQNKIDLIHVQWLPLPLVDMLALRHWRKTRPVIVTVHDSNPYNGDASKAMAMGFDKAISVADAIIVHTAQAKDRLVGRGLDDKKISVIPHGLLKSESRSGSRQPAPGMPGRDRFIHLLQLGKIKHYKGVDILLEALSMLEPAVLTRFKIIIAGKPYIDTSALQDQIERHGLKDCVTLDLRYLSEEEIALLFSWADLAVFPYREIDASGVAMNAVEEGLPLIASKTAGFAEIFHACDGAILFETENPGNLADGLRMLSQNPDMIAKMGLKMLEKKREIASWDEIADQTLALYQSVLAKHQGGTLHHV